ncbi:MAG TPA: DUF1328 domain-containing protein [Terriglobales bacterium]
MSGTKRLDVFLKATLGFEGNPWGSSDAPISMLYWAIICAVCALIFGWLGFSGIAAGFATVARFLLALFLILLVLTLIFGGVFRVGTH